MDKRTRAKFTTLAKRVNEASGTAADLATAKTDIENLKTSKANIEDLTAAAGRIDVLEAESASVKQLVAGKANVTDLTAATGRIDDLEADTASQLTEEQYKQALDGSVLVASSITTDKLAAGSVTAQVIASGAVTTDKLEVGAVKAKHIDVDDLFAQNITATGTITGAKLIGAVLSGGSIDISGTFDGYTGASEGYIRTLGDESGSPQLILGMGENRIKITDDAMESIVLDGPMIYIGAPGGASDTTVYNLWVQGDVSADGKHNTYTSFSGGVLSSGSVTVSKKLGMCYISGTLTLSKSISAWTTILSSSKVPAPQHGELVPFEASQWGTSYARPLRGKVTPDGGLQLVYGAAGNYVFTIAYPID